MLVIQVSVAIRNAPGTMITHQVFMTSALLARDNMLPQEITSTGNPRPKKLKVDSVVIVLPTAETTTNMIAGIKFGSKCVLKIYMNRPPQLLAYKT